ncbi:MAG TPA: hypothetical protein VHX38_07410 [Pseudonocardiaceae bacterium]|nr:hypothetical protein [Pseudonocardiaceae bacterium]
MAVAAVYPAALVAVAYWAGLPAAIVWGSASVAERAARVLGRTPARALPALGVTEDGR